MRALPYSLPYSLDGSVAAALSVLRGSRPRLCCRFWWTCNPRTRESETGTCVPLTLATPARHLSHGGAGPAHESAKGEALAPASPSAPRYRSQVRDAVGSRRSPQPRRVARSRAKTLMSLPVTAADPPPTLKTHPGREPSLAALLSNAGVSEEHGAQRRQQPTPSKQPTRHAFSQPFASAEAQVHATPAPPAPGSRPGGGNSLYSRISSSKVPPRARDPQQMLPPGRFDPSSSGDQQQQQPVRKKRSAAPQVPQRRSLPGGNLSDAVGVSPLAVDRGAEDRVLAMLRSDQQQANQDAEFSPPEPTLHHVPRSQLLRCVLELPLHGHPEGANTEMKDVFAIGQSKKATIARALCFMHAEQLLDYYMSARGASTSSTTAASTVPPPLEERGVAAPPTSPQPHHYRSWDEYVNASAAYVKTVAAHARQESFKREEVPRGGHPVADRATELLRRHPKRYCRSTALQELNQSVRDASRLMTTVRLEGTVFVSTLILDPQAGLAATGVSKNAKTAKRQCAAHALCILRLLQDDVDGRQEVDGAGRSRRGGAQKGTRSKENNASHQPSVPLESVLQQMQPAYRKIAQFHHLLFGKASLTPRTTFTKELKTASGSTGTTTYRCHLTLNGLSCDGTGINRFEAERAAMEAAMSDLMLYNKRLQAVQAFVNAHPSISPESIPSAALPAEVIVQLQSQLQPVIQQQAIDITSAVTEDVTQKNEGGDRSDNYNTRPRARGMSEQALLRLSERAFSIDPSYGAEMLKKMLTFRRDPVYLTQFHIRRSTLAMATVKAQLLDAIQRHRVTVVCGTTGCGKTTQVPQYILDQEIEHGRGGSCNILVTQPRRLSSFSVAERIAQERLSTVGKDVGYAVRLDARPGRHITVCTTGVLLQIFSTHPELEHVSHLIIDEVHERDINCDVILALVKQLLQRNQHLRVVLMSATMQADVFARYFGADTPVVQVEGAVYPVAIRYLADIAVEAAKEQFASPAFDLVPQGGQAQQEGKAKNPTTSISPATPLITASRRANTRKFLKIDYNLVAYLVHRSVQVDLQNNTEGKSILVFLPGWKELMSAMAAIKEYHGPHALPAAEDRFHIILLHSTVDSARQRECFQPAPPGTVKVVLATNIAESGITIDDAAVVIDTGLIKATTWESRPTSSYPHTETGTGGFLSSGNTTFGHTSQGKVSAESGAGGSNNSSAGTAVATPVFSTQLALGYASQANCTQRKGRAGRTQGGVCYRLFTKELWDSLPAFPEADIYRVPLTQVLLKLLALGHTDPKETLQTFLEPPSRTNVDASIGLLRGIGALGKEDRLTPLGEYLALLPCDPRIGKMIVVGAVLGCLDSVLTVAACTDVCPYVTSREMAAEARKKRYLLSRGSQSDHISFLNAYNAFCANEESEEFARLNLLHLGNLRVISKYKAQYRDILRQAGLINAHDSLEEGGVSAVNISDAVTQSEPEIVGGDRSRIEDAEGHSERGREAPQAGNRLVCKPAPLSYAGTLCVDTNSLSSHSFDVALVKACVCAALFPNVALLRPPSKALSSMRRLKTTHRVELRTKYFRCIKPAKDSVCRRVDGSRSGDVPDRDELLNNLRRESNAASANPVALGTSSAKPVPALFYVFQDVFGLRDSRQDFLTTLSAVSLWALLLFGASELTTEYNAELSICVVDGWIALHIDRATYTLLTQLRQSLFECLRGKYHNPHDPRNNSALETVTSVCRELLKTPVQGVPDARSSDSADGETCRGDAGRQHSSWQLVDMGSIIDPLVHLRRGDAGDGSVAAIAEEDALLNLEGDAAVE